MRLTKSFSIPDELERARANGELVIFAGAGVSVSPPANLPNFLELAKQIAEPRVQCSPDYARALDRYLGRAAREGVDVQSRARHLLANGGKHTPLHEDLLALFGDPQTVQLVTTNFDTHFATALSSVYPHASVPQYVGPALPPGQKFRGIVQLHGSLANDDFNLVLTDRDFGEAYMAEGWASRFLTSLFAHSTVLFVGYSLGDPIMQYLLHAIPANDRWFALWRHRDANRGADHRINSVTFGTQSSRKPYLDLNKGIKRWRWYATSTTKGHAHEIGRVVASGPPKSPVDADYLRARLRTSDGLANFCRLAKTVEWFEWISSNQYLDALFDYRSTVDVREWAEWCLNNFCTGINPPLLRYARHHSMGVHAAFAAHIVIYLWRESERLARPTVMQLVALLVNNARHHQLNDDIWGYLIGHLVKHDHMECALALLRVATEVGLEHNQPYEQYDVDDSTAAETSVSLTSKLVLRIAPNRLDYLIEEHLDALVQADPLSVLLLAEERLLQAYELLYLASGVEPRFDHLNYGRTSIAAPRTDRHHSVTDILIDLGKGAIEHLAAVSPKSVLSFAARHDQREGALLRRLSIYAYSLLDKSYSDDVIKNAISLRLAGDWKHRPELYLLLKAHFSSASVQVQRDFVDNVSNDNWWSEDFDEHDEHARFSLAQFLERTHPKNRIARAFAKRMRGLHPTWQESDKEGLWMRTRVGWGSETPSPISAEELKLLSPKAAFDTLRDRLQNTSDLGSSYSLQSELQQVVRVNPSWGTEFLISALAAEPSDSVLTESTLFGMREAVLEEADQLAFLSRVQGPWEAKHARTFGSVLLKWAGQLGETASLELLDAFDAAADVIYERSGTTESATSQDGWTERAINHAAGYAAQIWWKVANARDWKDGVYVPSLDDAERRRWKMVLADTTPSGAHARPILGMVTDRLTMADQPWTQEVIFPAFSFTKGEERAAQLWDGRLMQHQFFWGTLEGLREQLQELLQRSAEVLPSRAKELGDFIALLVAEVEHSRLSKVALQSFILRASEEARESFADSLPRHLSRLETQPRVQVWKTLLAPYWRDRRTNMPVTLSSAELEGMFRWLTELPEVADAVTAELRKSPLLAVSHADSVLRRWRDDPEWVEKHPDAAAGAILFLLERKSLASWSTQDAVVILAVAKKAGATTADVAKAAEALIQQFPELINSARDARLF